jgi:hypothetical protein
MRRSLISPLSALLRPPDPSRFFVRPLHPSALNRQGTRFYGLAGKALPEDAVERDDPPGNVDLLLLRAEEANERDCDTLLIAGHRRHPRHGRDHVSEPIVHLSPSSPPLITPIISFLLAAWLLRQGGRGAGPGGGEPAPRPCAIGKVGRILFANGLGNLSRSAGDPFLAGILRPRDGLFPTTS